MGAGGGEARDDSELGPQPGLLIALAEMEGWGLDTGAGGVYGSCPSVSEVRESLQRWGQEYSRSGMVEFKLQENREEDPGSPELEIKGEARPTKQRPGTGGQGQEAWGMTFHNPPVKGWGLTWY